MAHPWVLLIHLAATWFMVGLIWFVQVVHYPLFAGVGDAGFGAYHRRHTRVTTWVVGPVMLVELLTGVALVVAQPAGATARALWAGLGLIGVNWVSTAAVQVPCHGRLAARFSPDVHARLCRTNWVRTAAWTARGGLVLLAAGAAV